MSETPLTPTEFASAVTAVASAFGDPTRREIYLFAQRSTDGVTATTTAAQFDLHANVARHHLDKLVAGGYLEVSIDRSAGAGRPSKRYSAVSDINLEVPVRHDDILITLLGRALAELGAEHAEDLAENVGVEYGRAMSAAMGGSDAQQSFRAALHTVAEALTAHGFAAKAEKHGSELRIVSDHCPFGGAAVEHPVICAVDRGLVKGMLDGLYGKADAEVAASRPMGDDHCVTTVTG